MAEIGISKALVSKLQDLISTIDKHTVQYYKNSIYDSYYSKYKANLNTIYFFIFDTFQDKYLVNMMFNKHEKGYSRYVR